MNLHPLEYVFKYLFRQFSFYDTILYEYDPALTLKASQQPNGFRNIQHAGIKDLEPVEKIVPWVCDLVRAELKKNNPGFVMD